MKKIDICPFCGSENISWIGDAFGDYDNGDLKFYCHECEREFSKDDYEHEQLRQKISCVCSGEEATEENPIKCDVIIGNDDAQGLRELEKPQVTSVFQDHDGIVWVNIYGSNEPIEADMLSTSDLRLISDYLTIG